MKSSTSPNKIFEFTEYKDQLTKEELEYIQKFYKEHYFASFYDEDTDNIIVDEDAKKEAFRNNNRRSRDAFDKSQGKGQLEYGESKEDFMEQASDEWDWQGAYKIGGYELAVHEIMHQTERDLDNNKLDRKVVLARYFIKLTNLNREHMSNMRKNKNG